MASDDYEGMYTDLLKHLKDATHLFQEVKINKKNCFRLNQKILNLISTLELLRQENDTLLIPLPPNMPPTMPQSMPMPLSMSMAQSPQQPHHHQHPQQQHQQKPLISLTSYHKLIVILLDIQTYFKKSSIKRNSLFISIHKNKMKEKFLELSQQLNEILMEEPRFLPRETRNSFSTTNPTTNTTTTTTATAKMRSPLLTLSSLSFEESNLTKPAQEELIYRWILGNTNITRHHAERYAVILVRRSIHSEARLGRKVTREPNFLTSVGIPPQDAIQITEGLKSAGYLSLPSTSPSQQRISSQSDTTISRNSFPKTLSKISPSSSLKKLNACDILNIPELTPLTVETTLQAITLSQETKNESLAYVALVGVSELVEGSEEYQLNYGIQGGCGKVLNLLASMSHIENISEIALKSICLLCRYGKSRSTTSSENIAQFGSHDGCHLIITVANTFPENDLIQYWACKGIVYLSSNMENNQKLGEAGACEFICDLMQRRKDLLIFDSNHRNSCSHAFPSLPPDTSSHELNDDEKSDYQLSLHLWGSLINLALCTENNERFSDSNICYIMLLNWLERGTNNRSITLWGCMAIQNLALNEKNKIEIAQNRNSEHSATGCHLLQQALANFSTDEEISTQAFMAIQNLANHQNGNNTFLGNAGICEEIVNVMKIHLSDEYITQRACMAIMNLSYNHLENKLKFVNSQISESLELALSLHSGNSSVYEFACGAIVNLTDTEDFVEGEGKASGNGEGEDQNNLTSALHIVTHFAANSHIIDIIIDNLHSFFDDPSDTVIELGLWAIKNISLYHPELFDNINTCSVICRCMAVKLASPSIIEMSCWIVKTLSYANASISFKFGTVGICDQIISALQMHCNNEMLIEIGCATIQSLCELCEINRRILVNLDAYPLITKLIKQHFSNEIIESIGFAALASLSKMDDDGSSLNDSSVVRRSRSLSIGGANRFPSTEEMSGGSGPTDYLSYLSDDDELDDDDDEGNGEGDEADQKDVSSPLDYLLKNRDGDPQSDHHLAPIPSASHCDVNECISILQQLKNQFEFSTKFKSKRKLEEYTSRALALVSAVIRSEKQDNSQGKYQKELGERGACNLVTKIMIPLLASRVVCLTGIEAICSLCRYGADKTTSNPHNVSLLGINGACKVVVDSGTTHCCREVEENGLALLQFDVNVSVWVTRAITYLASNETNNSMFHQYGVSTVMYTIFHHNYQACSEYYSNTLVAISSSTNTTTTLSPSSSHQSSSALSDILGVMKQSWSAIINLALNSENGKSLCDIGICDYLVSYITLWKHFPVDVLLILILSLQNLSLTEKNREKLGRAGICTHIVRLLESYLRKDTSAGAGATMEGGGGVQVVIKPNQIEQLAQYACMAIHKLSLNSKNSDRFGDSRGCELILNVLQKYSGNMTIEQIGAMALVNLSSKSLKNVNCLLNNNILNNLSTMIANYSNYGKKIEGGCGNYTTLPPHILILEFTLKTLHNIIQLGYQDKNNQLYPGITRAKIVELLINTLKTSRKIYGKSIHPDSQQLATEIYTLLATHTLNIVIVLLPIEECQQHFMTLDLKSVIGKVAKDFKNKPEVFQLCSQIWEDIHPSNISSLSSADWSLHLSADSSKLHSTHQTASPPPPSEENWEPEPEIQITVPEVIALLKKGLRNKDDLTVANSLRFIYQLADGNHQLQVELGRQGACPEVAGALKLFRNSIIVCENGLRAVCYLTRYGQDKATANPEHIVMFGELGLCPVIVEILRKFSGNDKIALYGCNTIMNLGSLPENNVCFGQYGGCEVILIILQTFSHLDQVLKQALWALINLSSFDENNRRFYQIGCNLIVDLLKSNLSDEEICSWLLLTVQNLANYKENRHKFGELGVCEYVIHAMTIHMKHTPSIEFGCMALDKLGLDSQNNQKIGQSNGCELIINVITKHLENEMLCELAWKACHRIARDQRDNITALGRNNIAGLMCQVIQKYSHAEEVMEQLLVTLTVIMSYKTVIHDSSSPTAASTLASTYGTESKKKHRRTVTHAMILDGKPMKRLLGESGLCKPLVYLLELYTSDEAITKATHGKSNNIGMIYLCLKIISMLSIDDLINKIQFGEYGCCEKTIAAMTLHLGSEDIALKGCCAIASLVTNCPMNSQKFSAIGANAVIFRVLQKYTLTKKVIISGFDALISLTEAVITSTNSSENFNSSFTSASSQGRRHQHASRNTDESGFDIIGKIIRVNAQSIEITISGIRLIYLLLLSFVTRGSGTNIIVDSPHYPLSGKVSGYGDGKTLALSPKSIQIIGDIVQKSLTVFETNLNVSYHCLLIISELSIDAVNSSYLGSLGICSLVVQTIESLLFTSSTSDPLQTISAPSRQMTRRMSSHHHHSSEITEVDIGSTTHLSPPKGRDELATNISSASEDKSNAIQEILIFEVGLRAISSLAVDESNSQILSDCNVGDIVLKISSIYFLNENILKEATLCFSYFTKLTSIRNILMNNNLVALILKILSTYNSYFEIMKNICRTLANIFQYHHTEGCRELIERNLNSTLLSVFDHFKKDPCIVRDILFIHQKILEVLYPSSSPFTPQSQLQPQEDHEPIYPVVLHPESLCEKLCYVIKSHPDLSELSCNLIALLSFHYPHCSQQFYQHGYGELSLYLLHSYLDNPRLILHIFQSYKFIMPSCPEFLSTFSDSHFLDFIFHDILLSGENFDNVLLVQEVLYFTSYLLNSSSSRFCLETLLTSTTKEGEVGEGEEDEGLDDETYYSLLFRIISSYPNHSDIIYLSTAILSRIHSSLSNDNDAFIQSSPSLIAVLDSPSSSLVEIALTVLPLSRQNLPHQNHWILLLKSLLVSGFDRDMKFLTQQIHDHSLRIIEQVMELLSTLRCNLLQQNHIATDGCFILGFIGSLNLQNNVALSKVGFVSYSMEILTALLVAIQPAQSSLDLNDSNVSPRGSGDGAVVIPDHLFSLFDSLTYALCILSGSDSNRLILKDLNLCDFIGDLVLTFLSSEEIVTNCCQILVNLALIDDNSKVILGNNNSCEACYESFQYYLFISINILKSVCDGCATLALDDRNKDRFCQLSMGQVILQALDYYSTENDAKNDQDFIELGLSALINLSDHHEMNKNDLCSVIQYTDISTNRCGEPTSVDQIILRILRLHSSDDRLLELCFMLLVNMTEDSHLPSLERLSNLPLFQAVFDLIESLSSSTPSSDLCIQGLWYLRNIFNYCNLRQTDLFQFLSTNIQSLCRCILGILSRNTSTTEFNSLLVEQSSQCLLALLHLSSPSTSFSHSSLPDSNSCCEHLINLNGFSSLLAICYVYSKDEQIVSLVSQILSFIVLYTSNYSTQEIEGTLERLCTIHEIITSIFVIHSTHELISLSSLQILYAIMQRNSDSQIPIKDWSDCSEAIVQSLEANYENSQIVILSSELILLLSSCSREYQSIIGATGGGDAYIVTILHYLQRSSPHSDTIQNDGRDAEALVVLCIRACNSLLTNNAANVVMIGPNLRQVVLQVFSVIIENCLLANSSPAKLYSDLVTNSFICLKLLAGSNKQFFIDSGALHHISELLVWDFIHPMVDSCHENSLPLSIAACDALLALLGEDCIDFSLFGGIDLPSCLLKKLLKSNLEADSDSDQSPGIEFLHKSLQLVLTILRLDSQTTNPKNKRILADYPLLLDTHQLMLHHHKSLVMMELFVYVINMEGLHALVETNESKEELRQTLTICLESLQESSQQEEQQEWRNDEFSQTIFQQLNQLFEDYFSD